MKNSLVVKAIIGGLLSMTVSLSAHALNAGETAAEIANFAKQSPTLRAFVETNLGLKGAAAVDAVEIGKALAANAAVAKQLSAYAAKAEAVGAEKAAATLNVNGTSTSATQVAQASNVATAKSSTPEGVAEVNSCEASVPADLARETGESEADIRAAIAAGDLVLTGTCGKDITSLKTEPKTNLVHTAVYALRKGITAKNADEAVFADGLVESFAKQGVQVAREDALKRVAGVASECGWLPAQAGAQ